MKTVTLALLCGALLFGQAINQHIPAPGGGEFVLVATVCPHWPDLDGYIVNQTGVTWRDLIFRLTLFSHSRELNYELQLQDIGKPGGQFRQPIEDAVKVFGTCDAITLAEFSLISFRSPERPNIQAKILRAEEKEREKRAAQAAAEKAWREKVARASKVDRGSASVPVAADKRCLDQTVASINGEGLEARKRFDELLRYGCFFMVPRMTPVIVGSIDSGSAYVTIMTGPRAGRNGWVLPQWIKGATGVPVKPAVPGTKI
jgi:hypothetical protein